MAPEKKWSLGVLNDKEWNEVPGSILLIPQSQFQEPLGFPETVDGQPPNTQTTTPEVQASPSSPSVSPETDADTAKLAPAQTNTSELKRTPDGRFVLDPQPDDNPNDPLNWVSWRRDLALLSLGWHCLVGGGQTPILAAGFNDVAREFGVTFSEVALTTGLFMMGMGVGSLFASPLAIIYGKRPIYLIGVILFLISSIWSAAAPDYINLVIARIVMGIGISPCESLPSATIAEIFFLHERAYRVGIYTLLLLGGKNLVPLVSAVVINAMSWRWVFWIVAIIVGFNFFLLFFFVPETFWDRTPHRKPTRPGLIHRASSMFSTSRSRASSLHRGRDRHVPLPDDDAAHSSSLATTENTDKLSGADTPGNPTPPRARFDLPDPPTHSAGASSRPTPARTGTSTPSTQPPRVAPFDLEKHLAETAAAAAAIAPAPGGKTHRYGNPTTTTPKTYVESLRVWNGRLRGDSFIKAFVRPVILFAYPAILWSTFVYSLSVGWLIVLSESVAHVYMHHPYNFTALQTGLVYLSPFVGGVLGTAVAGKASDLIVRFMARRNSGVYEPEFRLVMAVPIAFCTALGLMGFGWSAEEADHYMVPTIFFGVISFGCSLGSTTAITFAVDSYRQFAGEALVSLNFSKNVFHGLVFSLFFPGWLEDKGSREVFIVLGGIQLIVVVAAAPLYVYGKRCRAWTARKDLAGKWDRWEGFSTKKAAEARAQPEPEPEKVAQ